MRPPSSTCPCAPNTPPLELSPLGYSTLWYQTLHRPLGFLESACGAGCSHSLEGPATVRAKTEASRQQHRVSRGRLSLWGCSWRTGTTASRLLTRNLQPLGQSRRHCPGLRKMGDGSLGRKCGRRPRRLRGCSLNKTVH